MNYPQLWRSSGLALSLLLSVLAAPSAQAAAHTVRSGDTFSAIARKYNISIASLQKANPRVKPGVIAKGQVLNLPGSVKTAAPKTTPVTAKSKAKPARTREPARPAKISPAENADRLTAGKPPTRTPSTSKRSSGTITTYKVKSGETLTSLARRAGTSVGELAEMNGLENLELHEGQKLVLPAGSSAPPPARVRVSQDPENTVDLTPPAKRPSQEGAPARRSAPPVQSPTPQGTYYHVVKRGDTFSSIARERGVSLTALTKANSAVNPNRLSLNQKLNVPGVQVASRQTGNQTIEDETPSARTTSYQFDAPGESETGEEGPPTADAPAHAPAKVAYRVTERDSMDSIAKAFHTTPKELRRLNQMGTFDRLTAGNYISVPWQNTPAAE